MGQIQSIISALCIVFLLTTVAFAILGGFMAWGPSGVGGLKIMKPNVCPTTPPSTQPTTPPATPPATQPATQPEAQPATQPVPSSSPTS